MPCAPAALPCATGKPLRVPVTDVFKSRAGGLAVGGKVEAGALRVGCRVMVVPGHTTGTVRGLEVGGQVRARCKIWVCGCGARLHHWMRAAPVLRHAQQRRTPRQRAPCPHALHTRSQQPPMRVVRACVRAGVRAGARGRRCRAGGGGHGREPPALGRCAVPPRLPGAPGHQGKAAGRGLRCWQHSQITCCFKTLRNTGLCCWQRGSGPAARAGSMPRARCCPMPEPLTSARTGAHAPTALPVSRALPPRSPAACAQFELRLVVLEVPVPILKGQVGAAQPWARVPQPWLHARARHCCAAPRWPSRLQHWRAALFNGARATLLPPSQQRSVRALTSAHTPSRPRRWPRCTRTWRARWATSRRCWRCSTRAVARSPRQSHGEGGRSAGELCSPPLARAWLGGTGSARLRAGACSRGRPRWWR